MASSVSRPVDAMACTRTKSLVVGVSEAFDRSTPSISVPIGIDFNDFRTEICADHAARWIEGGVAKVQLEGVAPVEDGIAVSEGVLGGDDFEEGVVENDEGDDSILLFS